MSEIDAAIAELEGAAVARYVASEYDPKQWRPAADRLKAARERLRAAAGRVQAELDA